MKRDFKGIWIPKSVWFDERLTALEKIVLAEIDSLDGERGCFAGNDTLAEFCQCSVTKVSLAISKLINLGYIYTASFNGRERVLKSRLSKNERQTYKKCEADLQNLKGENETLHIISNDEIKDNITDIAFEAFWEAYPKKINKKQCEKAFKRIPKKEYPDLLDALTFQKMSPQWKKDNGQYIPYPLTWLHQERWKVDIPRSADGSFNEDDFIRAAMERAGG